MVPLVLSTMQSAKEHHCQLGHSKSVGTNSHENAGNSHSHWGGFPFPSPTRCFIPIPMGLPWDSHSHWESHSHAHLCVNGDISVLWKSQKFDSHIIEPPDPIGIKFGTVDSVCEATPCAKFYANPLVGGFSANGWNICTNFYLYIPFFRKSPTACQTPSADFRARI